MTRRIIILIPALLSAALLPLRAANITCSLQVGPTGPVNSQACDQALATPTASLNWSSVVTAVGDPTNGYAGPLTGNVGGTALTVSSPNGFGLEGADNVAMGWNGSSWVPIGFVNSNITTFAGDFNSATTPTGPPPEGIYGDNLLGVISPAGNSPGNAEVTLSFATPLTFIEFEVSARTQPNFLATLTAFDSNGNVLGTYTVNDTGTGGTGCSGMYDSPPQPCNDAPFVQYFDAQDRIASVELTINDQSGEFLDTLQVATTPEPASFAAFGSGMFALLFWAYRRGKFRRPASLTTAARD